MARTGSFPLQTAVDLLAEYGRGGEAVLDPFCGKGTSLLAARLLGMSAYGVDVAPEAVVCTAAKQAHVTQFSTLEYVHRLKPRKNGRPASVPSSIRTFFNPKTLEDLLQVRSAIAADLCDTKEHIRQHALVALAALLGILHGHASYSLSIPSAHAYSMAPAYVSRFAAEKGLSAPERNVKACLSIKLSKVFADPLPRPVSHYVARGSAIHLERVLPRGIGPVDIVLTSPPYLNAQTYAKDNWLRQWLLGYDYRKLNSRYLQTGSIQKFSHAMLTTMLQIAQILRPGGHLICVAGDIRLRSRKGVDEVLNTSSVLGGVLKSTNLFDIQDVQTQTVASSRRYYHALVNSNGHRRVPLIERVLIAKRRT